MKLQDWEKQANAIQADYKQQIEAYQAQSEVYKNEVITYQKQLALWQVGQGSAVSPAEFAVGKYYNDLKWTVVNKRKPRCLSGARSPKTGWFKLFIILVLFVAILFLQKRKDVI